jgi:hypothetical protein
MTAREPALRALSLEETGRAPMDLSGMPSTSVSCFAYPDLVKTVRLPPRPPRVYHTGQVLELPGIDVLDAPGCCLRGNHSGSSALDLFTTPLPIVRLLALYTNFHKKPVSITSAQGASPYTPARIWRIESVSSLILAQCMRRSQNLRRHVTL